MFPDDKVYVLQIHPYLKESAPKSRVRLQVRLWKRHTQKIIPIAIEMVKGDDPQVVLIDTGILLGHWLDDIYDHFEVT
jgi:hypothetical protein